MEEKVADAGSTACLEGKSESSEDCFVGRFDAIEDDEGRGVLQLARVLVTGSKVTDSNPRILDILKVLVSSGCNLDIRDKVGW